MYVLIPAYQPDMRLPRLVSELRLSCDALIPVVVDDGSGPAYRPFFEAASAAGAQVVSYEANRGKGYALRQGFATIASRAHAGDVVVTADADGQHSVDDILRVGRECSCTGQMVLGVRHFAGKVPLRSRVGNVLTAGVFWLATGWKLGDTQTGLRAFSYEQLPALMEIQGDRYEYELRVLLWAAQRRLPVSQVTIETIYEEGNPTSHFRPLQDSARIWAPLLKFAASSGVTTVIDYVMALVLHTLMGAVFWPVLIARVVSASVNFSLNRRVFQAQNSSVVRTGAKYALLALVVIAGSYAGISALMAAGAPMWVAKVVADSVMYLVSFTAQRHLVFTDRREHSGVGAENTQGARDTRAMLETQEVRNPQDAAVPRVEDVPRGTREQRGIARGGLQVVSAYGTHLPPPSAPHRAQRFSAREAIPA